MKALADITGWSFQAVIGLLAWGLSVASVAIGRWTVTDAGPVLVYGAAGVAAFLFVLLLREADIATDRLNRGEGA